MPHIISNTGFPSLSRNHAKQNGVWQTFDGLSYTCKIGNFIYDWVIESSTGKVFLAVQSPTPTFSYKSYATDECKYFGIQFGTGDPKDNDLEKSKLIDPPTNYLDPCLFNANWQGIDGSMISWISNENNTGVSSSTFVMVGGQFYDLGKPILGAALNQGFILAIHCEDGVAVFCEYSTKDSQNGSVTKRLEKNLNQLLPIDDNEINRLKEEITKLKEPLTDETGKKAIYDAQLETNKSEWSSRYGMPYDPLKDFGQTVYYANDIQQLAKDYLYASVTQYGCTYRQVNFKNKGLVNHYNSRIKGIENKYVTDNYRASFSTDLTKILLHIGFEYLGIKNKFNFNQIVNKSTSFGFATFDLEIQWTNEEDIKNAIKFNVAPIPEKKFTYSLTHSKSKYFEPCEMFFWEGADDYPQKKSEYFDSLENIDDYMKKAFEFGKAGSEVVGIPTYSATGYLPDANAVMRGKLQTETAFIFAELVGNVPTWLLAKIDSEMVSGFTYGYAYSTNGQLNWKEVF